MRASYGVASYEESPVYLRNAEFLAWIEGPALFKQPLPTCPEVFEWAKYYHEQGLSVIHLGEMDKKPVYSWCEYQTRLPALKELKGWFPPGTKRNIGIVTGAISGINVIDCDTAEAYQSVIGKEVIEAPMVKTARGKHLFCKAAQGAANFQARSDLPKVDFRGEGGYVVAPPSIHPSGKQYQWLYGSDCLALPDLPGWLLSGNRKEGKSTPDLLGGVSEGGRNNALASLAGRWLNEGKTPAEVQALAAGWNRKNSPPMEDEEVCRTVRSICNRHETEERNHHIETCGPMPLRRSLPAPVEFPLEAFPPVLRDVVKLAVDTVQVPPALAGQSVLAASALAAQGLANIAVDGRVYPVSNFFVTIAETGERKSAVDRLFLAPHHDRQRSLATLAVSQRQDFNIAITAWKHRRDSIIKKQKSASFADFSLLNREIGNEPIPPRDPLFLVEEPTYEGLIKLLETGQPTVGLFSDEGGRFIGGHGMNKDNILKTIAGLSKLWDGDPITRSRSGDGHTILYNRRCSMHLMIQPQIMPSLFGQGLLAGQGFLSRVLCAFPASTIGTRYYREANIASAPAYITYCEALRTLLNTPLPVLADEPAMGLQLPSIRLTTEAKETWMKFHDRVETNLSEGQTFASIRGLAAKAAEHALRIAAVFSRIEDRDGTLVNGATMADAVKLMDYYLQEALRLFGHGDESPDLKLAEDCLAWGQHQGGYIELTRLYQYGPNQLRNKARALQIIRILGDHGWLEKIEGGMELEGRRYTNVWRVIAPC